MRRVSHAVSSSESRRGADREVVYPPAMRSRTALAPFAAVTVFVLALVLAGCGGPPPPAKMSATTASNDSFAQCGADATVVGGGYEIAPSARMAGKIPLVVASRPTETGWKVECVDADGKTSSSCKAYVICATVLH